MEISEERLKEICKAGQGKECCRYLVFGSEGFECAKHTGLAVTLDIKVETNTMRAQGNNCEGILENRRRFGGYSG